MELRQNFVCFRQHLDSARVFGNLRAGERPKGNIVGECVQVGSRPATSEAEGRPAAVGGLRYYGARGPAHRRGHARIHLLNRLGDGETLPRVHE